MLLSPLLLAACATALQPPEVAPAVNANALAHWAHAEPLAASTGPDASALAHWWQQFDDPSLESLVRQALAANLDMKIAQANLRAAQAARAATESGFSPVVGTSGSATRNTTRQTGNNTYRLSLNASWEPDLAGTQRAALTASQADEQAAQADVAATQVSLSGELALAYLQWRNAQARESITRESLASLEQTRQLAQWKAQAGLASGLDVDQSRLAVEQTRASLIALTDEITSYEHTMALLLGLSPAQWKSQWQPPLSAGAGRVPQATAALQRLAIGLPADLLRRRPDLQAAEAQVRGAWARTEQTRRAGFPGLSLTGSLGLQALTVGGLSSAGAGLATLAAAVDWTLFDAGARQAQVAQQQALLDASRSSYDAAVLSAVKDVEDSLATLQSGRARADALQQAADAAGATLAGTQAQHQAGLTDFATLLEAQRNELSARLALQSGATDVSLQLVRLYKALGGGWQATDTPRAAASS
ncbi:TolC family protein [Ideonella sp. DXS29W]|uniref:TolC family protein n=1 Tax=Ideonella lacteola TaxID=2984193 RepID=A0ABU9BQM8_9BURK